MPWKISKLSTVNLLKSVIPITFSILLSISMLAVHFGSTFNHIPDTQLHNLRGIQCYTNYNMTFALCDLCTLFYLYPDNWMSRLIRLHPVPTSYLQLVTSSMEPICSISRILTMWQSLYSDVLGFVIVIVSQHTVATISINYVINLMQIYLRVRDGTC